MPSSYIHVWFYWSFITVKMSTEPNSDWSVLASHTQKKQEVGVFCFFFATHMLTQPTKGLLKAHKNHVEYRSTDTLFSHTVQSRPISCLKPFLQLLPGRSLTIWIVWTALHVHSRADCSAVTVCKHVSLERRQDDKMRRYMITVLGF